MITVGTTVLACGTKEHSKSADEISGAYVREYTFKVVNPETGAEIGMRTIRDTIFIRPVDEKYEISNRKWKMNDFDNDGWRNMEHAEDKPMPTYLGVYKPTGSSLISESMMPLHFDPQKSKLYKAKVNSNPYLKVK